MKLATLAVGAILAAWGIWVLSDQSSLSQEFAACADVFGAPGASYGQFVCSATAAEGHEHLRTWAVWAMIIGIVLAVGSGFAIYKELTRHPVNTQTNRRLDE